jgi:cell division transport system permease protein
MFYKTDMSFEGDSTQNFLPWIIAFMIFLASVTLTAFMGLNRMLNYWDLQISSGGFVQFYVEKKEAEDEEEKDGRVEDIKDYLTTVDGIENVSIVKEDKVRNNISEWFGQDMEEIALELPRVIEFSLKEGVLEKKMHNVKDKIKGKFEDIDIEFYQNYAKRFFNVLNALLILSTLIMAFISLAVVATVIHATKSSLAVHRPYIEILHLIGAKDEYIANQFGIRTLVLALIGLLIGILISFPILYGIKLLAENVDLYSVSGGAVSSSNFGYVLLIGMVICIISLLTARITVFKTLKKFI